MKIKSFAIVSALLLAMTFSGPVGAADPDTDSDSVPDGIDNCRLTPNTDQRDEDMDGIGTACDCDFLQDGFVLGDDSIEQFFKLATTLGVYDITGDGFVLGDDLQICGIRFNTIAGDL